MIIEDKPDEWAIIEQAIKRTWGDISPIWATDETEALRYLDACALEQRPLPRLVLLDLYLPQRQQGWQFLEEIRARAWQRYMSVVVLSRSTEPTDVSTSYDLGANSYIAKPADFEGWFEYFSALRSYWLETVTLPCLND